MKVVVAHNHYVSANPSGENAVVDDELRLLREQGIEVHPYLRSSDEIAALRPGGRAALALGPIYSRRGVAEFSALLQRVRPDVVHLHNPFPLLSPWVIRAAAERSVPVVQTVHNYRHTCVAGTHFRQGRTCDDCLGKRLAIPAVIHGCYRGSRPQSVPMVVGQAVHRTTWLQVSRFLVLTPFMADRLRLAGVPAERLTVRPTSLGDPGPPGPLGRDFVFIGRLCEEKGVDLLLAAWEQSGLCSRGLRLVLVGDGPMLADCQAKALQVPGIDVVGRASAAEVRDHLSRARAVVVPSVWYEGFPRVIVEAFAHARPVVATNLGSLGDIVDPSVGWTAEPTAGGLASALVIAADGDGDRLGRQARERFLRELEAKASMAQLIAVYSDVARSSG